MQASGEIERSEQRDTTKYARIQWVDCALTYLTTICLIGALMLTYHVAVHRFGEMGLSQYAVMRRIIAFVQPLLELGMGVALSRKVASLTFEPHSTAESSYSLAALLLILCSTAAFFLPVVCFPKLFAYAFFGSVDYYPHTLVLCPMVVGLGLYIVAYAQLQGRLAMRKANLLQLLNIGILPLIVMKCAPNLPVAFLWTGVAVSVTSCIALIPQFWSRRAVTSGLRQAIVELALLGPRRVPGDAAYFGLLMLPAILAAHTCGLKQGGLVAFGVTLLTLAQSVSTPISTLMLPQATAMLRSGNVRELRSKVIGYFLASAGVTAAGIFVFWLTTDVFLQICVGQVPTELPGLTRLLIIGALPLNLHTCLRSIVDAGRDDAVNARSSFLSMTFFLIVFAAATQAIDDLYAPLVALLGALFFLAGLTSWEVWRLLGPNSAWTNLGTNSLQREAA